MNTDTFFEHFDSLIALPGGVAKVRELIFELASRGALLDEASVTLESIVSETCLLGDRATFVMGQAPPGSECNEIGNGTLFVKAGEFGKLFPLKEAWTTKPLKFAADGDVLICVVGATVGKLNMGINCAIGRSVAAIRPDATLDSKFLYYSLMPYVLKLRNASRGSAQGVIGRAELAGIRLWIPPLPVQQRCVTKVDQLMELCDQLETRLAGSQVAAERLLASSIASVLEGTAG